MWPYQSFGSPDYPVILFLHGFLGRGSDWAPIAKPLAEEFHILFPDLPGHGEHLNRDPGDRLDFDLLSDELEQLLGTITSKKIILVGYSLGGRLAQHFALHHPGRVRGLVLESTSPGLSDPAARRLRAALDDTRAQEILKYGLPAFLNRWYQADLWTSLRARAHLLEALIRDRSARNPIWMAKAIADLSPGRMESLWNRLPNLRVPTLLIHGALDEKYSGIAARMRAFMPDATLTSIADAGHNTHLEQPEFFLDALKAFLYNPA